jgi:MFS superfamily sulfate permease-like transporter
MILALLVIAFAVLFFGVVIAVAIAVVFLPLAVLFITAGDADKRAERARRRDLRRVENAAVRERLAIARERRAAGETDWVA